MSRCHCIEPLFGKEIAKPGITQAASGLFDGFGRLSPIWTRTSVGFGGGIDAVAMKGQMELGGEGVDEFEIGVGFRSAKAVVEMRDMEDEAKFPAPMMEGVQEGNRVGSAGDADGQTQAGGERGGVERESGMMRVRHG